MLMCNAKKPLTHSLSKLLGKPPSGSPKLLQLSLVGLELGLGLVLGLGV